MGPGQGHFPDPGPLAGQATTPNLFLILEAKTVMVDPSHISRREDEMR